MKKNKYDLKKLIQRALSEKAKDRISIAESSQCLTDEAIRALYEGNLSEAEREAAVQHLDRCPNCLADLAFYFELMSPQEQAAILVKIKQLQLLLPQLRTKLDGLDFISLCKKLLALSKKVIGRAPTKTIQSAVDEMLARLSGMVPKAIVQIRGEVEDYKKDTPNFVEQTLKEIGMEMQETVNQQLVLFKIQQQCQRNWAGWPELWVFERLTKSLREQATNIRDWCEEQLELINLQEKTRHLPSVGIGHSKRVLGHAVSLLKVFQGALSGPLTCFVVYVGSYCHHLGMLLKRGDQSDGDNGIQQVWENHSKRTHDVIMGNPHLGILPAWPVMGFSSEKEAMLVADICTSGQETSEEFVTMLPGSQSAFLEGKTMNIWPLAAAAVLRLADVLDCSFDRLPQVQYLKSHHISEELLREYFKHEIVQEVNINEKGVIHVKMRLRYKYPAKWGNIEQKVRQQLERQIVEIQKILMQSGISLPNPEFDSTEALFLERHPYLR